MTYRMLVAVMAAYAFAVFAVALVSNVRAATLSPTWNTGSCRLPFDIACYLPGGKHEDPDIATANNVITQIEVVALNEIAHNPPHDLYHEVTLLGKVELYDRNLSVNKNLACASCHVPESGFTNASSPSHLH